MKDRLNLNDPQLHDHILLGFHEDEWNCNAGIPEPYASLLSDRFPDLPLDSEAELYGVMWCPVDEVDDPLRQRVFKLTVDAARQSELWEALQSVRLTRLQVATSCVVRLWPQTEEFFEKVENLGGRFIAF